MPLAFAFHESFAPAAVDPTLQGIQFVERGLMRLLQLLVRGGRLVQHAAEFGHLLLGIDRATLKLCGLLESRQQELLALGKIVGKRVGVIHNADCFTDSCQSRKTTSQKTSSTDPAIPSPPTPVSQVEAAEDLRQLRIVQFDALLFAGASGN